MPIKVGPIPSDIQRCFDEVVGQPKKGAMTTEQAFDLIGRLAVSELEKSKCGKRLIRWVRQFQ